MHLENTEATKFYARMARREAAVCTKKITKSRQFNATLSATVEHLGHTLQREDLSQPILHNVRRALLKRLAFAHKHHLDWHGKPEGKADEGNQG